MKRRVGKFAPRKSFADARLVFTVDKNEEAAFSALASEILKNSNLLRDSDKRLDDPTFDIEQHALRLYKDTEKPSSLPGIDLLLFLWSSQGGIGDFFVEKGCPSLDDNGFRKTVQTIIDGIGLYYIYSKEPRKNAGYRDRAFEFIECGSKVFNGWIVPSLEITRNEINRSIIDGSMKPEDLGEQLEAVIKAATNINGLLSRVCAYNNKRLSLKATVTSNSLMSP